MTGVGAAGHLLVIFWAIAWKGCLFAPNPTTHGV